MVTVVSDAIAFSFTRQRTFTDSLELSADAGAMLTPNTSTRGSWVVMAWVTRWARSDRTVVTGLSTNACKSLNQLG